MRLLAPTSETTETSLLVVLADIWLIVPPDGGSEVFGGSDRPFSVGKVCAPVSGKRGSRKDGWSELRLT